MPSAQKGINDGLVGKQPDTQATRGSGGARGITQSSDEPYRANNIIPGSGGGHATREGFGDGALDMNSFSDFAEDRPLDIEQGVEQAYEEVSEVAGMAREMWVNLGRRCYDTGRTFFRQGYQTQQLNNTFLFKGQHEPGSKYNHEAFRNRSRIFRPLTRMAARSWEADVASALFMNDDYMHITPRNVSDPDAEKAAAVLKELVNLRLDKNWYTTCIGAAQDTFINGPVIGKVYWLHESVDKETDVPVFDDEGKLIGIETQTETKIVKDEPCIEVLLPENFIFDPTANWQDVVGTSKYFVHRKMMSVDDVIIRMQRGEWNLLEMGEILTCRWAMEDDAVQQSKRGEGRPDPINNDNADTLYESVMVNEVFVRRDGCWYVYHMMGTNWLLEDPRPLEERYHYGRLPFVYGTAMIESHNNIADSKVQLGSELQRAVNEVTNQRVDNVKLALNKRTIVKRGAAVDLNSLTRSSPGGVVFTSDPANDIVPMEVSDVTQSSYEEVQRMTMEMNEAQGTFSGQAVANNRQMNETVGGMKLLSNAATKVVDFDIRTFVFTWVRPVLELYMLCIQYYENDETIMEIAANNSAYFPRLSVQDLSDDLMTKQLDLKVDVGLGATDPVQRVNTLMFGVDAVANLPGMADSMDAKAVGSSIFAALGQGDGSKFFPNLARNYVEQEKAPPPPDPLVLAAQEEAKGRVQEAQIKADQALQLEQMRLAQDRELRLIEMALKAELEGKGNQMDILKVLLQTDAQMKIAGATDATKRQTAALQAGMSMRDTAMNQAAQVANQVTPTQQEIQNDVK